MTAQTTRERGAFLHGLDMDLIAPSPERGEHYLNWAWAAHVAFGTSRLPMSADSLAVKLFDTDNPRRNVAFEGRRVSDGSAVGIVGLQSIAWLNREARLMCIPATHACFGACEEALALTIHYGFSELGLHRLYDFTHSTHKDYVDALQDLGFRREGTLREAVFQGGKYRDLLVMAKLADEHNFAALNP